MRGPALASALILAAAPVLAQQDDPAVEDSAPEGFDLMQEGAELLFRGLMDEMGPAIDELQGLAEQVGPALEGLTDEMGQALAAMLAQIDEITNYQLPEFLPNGDIIIRRRPDAPEWTPPAEGLDPIDL
jgi:hypothetical protein